jgi:DNA polymerase III subunit epsilon
MGKLALLYHSATGGDMTHPDLFPQPPAPKRWCDAPFAALDFEATGTDPFTARPVSFAFAIVDAKGKVVSELSSLIDCGVEIPAEATAVHGITTEDVREGGVDPAWAMEQITNLIDAAAHERAPLVIMNARYDWPLLLAESIRSGRLWMCNVPLLDPGLLDKGNDKYRKGKRKLVDLCAHYGVPLEAAHTAGADAVAAARLGRAIINKYPWMKASNPTVLQGWQARVFEEYRSFLCRDGSHTIAKGWPIPEQPAPSPAAIDSGTTPHEREEGNGTDTTAAH